MYDVSLPKQKPEKISVTL